MQTGAESKAGRPDLAGHTDAVIDRVCRDYPEDLQEIVLYYLDTDCGRNLPFCASCNAEQLERVQLRVLDLARSNLKALQSLVETAKKDWRDVLSPTLAERGLPPLPPTDPADFTKRDGESMTDYIRRTRRRIRQLEEEAGWPESERLGYRWPSAAARTKDAADAAGAT